MRIVVALSVAAIAPLAFAQNDAAVRAASGVFDAAQVSAAAGAVRAGDEALSCEQTYAEFATLAQSPGFQSFAQQQGGFAGGALTQFQQNPNVAAGLAVATGQAGPAAEAAPAEEGRRRGGGGFLKKIGQAAGAAGALGGLGGRGAGGAIATAAAVGAVQGQAGGELGGLPAAVALADQTAVGQPAVIGQLTQLTELSPEIMRGSQLLELGQAKNCEWTKGGAPVGAPPVPR